MKQLAFKRNGRVVVFACTVFVLIIISRLQNERDLLPIRYFRRSKVTRGTTRFPWTSNSVPVSVGGHLALGQNLDFSKKFKLHRMSGSYAEAIPFPMYNHTLPNSFINPDKNLSRYKYSILAFSHTPKSGGTTIKRCMKTVSELSGKRSPLILNGPSCISTRLELLTGKLREEMIDSFAGSLLGICDHVKRKSCAYFTIMRDPYDRLISHYFFCKAGKQTFLSCENKTIVEFARRVGSTVFTQLSAQFKCLREREIRKQNETWRCYKKDFAYEPQSRERDLMLAYLVENLESLFAVIGLTEEFDLSLKLLQHTFGWPFFDECKGEKFNVGSYAMNNSDSVTQSDKWEKVEAREILLANEEIRDALYPDVVLYQRAKEIFQKEKEAFLRINSS